MGPLQFTCPTKYAVDARAVAADVPAWRYRYMADWPNLRLYEAFNGYPDSGTYHGADLNMLFGTAVDVSGEQNGAEEDQMSTYSMSAWAALARDPAEGLNEFGWSRYGEGEDLVLLGKDNWAGSVFADAEVYDVVCPPVKANDPLPGRGAF